MTAGRPGWAADSGAELGPVRGQVPRGAAAGGTTGPAGVPRRAATVPWGRVLAVWPLAFVLSVAGSVLGAAVVSAARTGEVGVPDDTRYVALWAAMLAIVPAVLVGVPVLALVAVVLRTAALAWQVATVGWAAAWVAGGTAAFLRSPWGPFRWMSVDPAAPYPWADVAVLVGVAALAWAAGSAAAWAVVRPVRPTAGVPAGW